LPTHSPTVHCGSTSWPAASTLIPTHWPGYFGHTVRSGGPMSVSGMARLVGSPEHRTHWSHLADAVRTGEAVPPKLYGMSAWDYIERTADEYCTSKRVFR
jgi:hypothetical protein